MYAKQARTCEILLPAVVCAEDLWQAREESGVFLIKLFTPAAGKATQLEKQTHFSQFVLQGLGKSNYLLDH
jgi:hypothetical protein